MEAKRLGAGAVMTMVLGASVLACGGGTAGRAPEAPSGGGHFEPSVMAQPGATPASPSTGAESDSSARASEAPAERQGLGTEWGESRFSRISTVPFVRADADSPFATQSLHYNDAAGARAMANASGFRRTSSGGFTMASGAISIGLKDDSGEFFRGFVAGERDYVVGEAGSRYVIVLRNRTDARFEAVVSVDGLDVLDGKAASFRKRGYLLEPRGELEIDGFRQSTESVAAFRFGAVRDSYASQKHGDTRNVGVIGVALFHERGSNPFDRGEVRRRHDANPFPGQFASPPN